MKEPGVLIITGDGLNCERETAYAFQLAGAAPAPVHITDLLDSDRGLSPFQILAFIGGFSNGDHLGAGTVQAGLFKHKLKEDLDSFIRAGKPIIGICNGFQTLVKMGILPGTDSLAEEKKSGGAAGPKPWAQTATLMANDSGKFEDRWVHLLLHPGSPCIWTRGLDRLFLPVRHGEGKFFATEPGLIPRLFRNGQVVAQYTDQSCREAAMSYPLNPNGSLAGIAGICDPTGTIFGLIPHPEAYLSPYNHPSWTREAALGRNLPALGQGAAIFRNAVDYVCGRSS